MIRRCCYYADAYTPWHNAERTYATVNVSYYLRYCFFIDFSADAAELRHFATCFSAAIIDAAAIIAAAAPFSPPYVFFRHYFFRCFMIFADATFFIIFRLRH